MNERRTKDRSRPSGQLDPDFRSLFTQLDAPHDAPVDDGWRRLVDWAVDERPAPGPARRG